VIAITCRWGGDLSVGASGDINVALIQAEIQQRLVRRLLTNPGEYVWHADYGAGLGGYVGETYSPGFIEGAVLNQLQLEALIAGTPAPSVQTSLSVTGPFSTISVAVQYQVVGGSTLNSIALNLGTK
jgi:hypothetical protein